MEAGIQACASVSEDSLSGEGFIKSLEPLTDDTFDNNSRKLGRDVGMNLPSYIYRRGNLQVIDVRYARASSRTLC